jgi:cold shock CspA family protein
MSKKPFRPKASRGGNLPAVHRRKTGERPTLPGRPTIGRITRLSHGQGHGFLRAEDDREVYFHRADVTGGFNDLVVGDAVTFDLFDDPVTGPRALRLRKAG